MDIYYNNELINIPEGSSVSEVLAGMETAPINLIVEVNGKFVPESEYSDFVVAKGDRITVKRL